MGEPIITERKIRILENPTTTGAWVDNDRGLLPSCNACIILLYTFVHIDQRFPSCMRIQYAVVWAVLLSITTRVSLLDYAVPMTTRDFPSCTILFQ